MIVRPLWSCVALCHIQTGFTYPSSFVRCEQLNHRADELEVDISSSHMEEQGLLVTGTWITALQ